MSFKSYLDKNKVLLEDPPYYALIAAAKLVADPDNAAKIDHAWGGELRSPSRGFDLKFGIGLVDQNPEWDMQTYLFAAIVQSDSNNMAIFNHYFPALTIECRLRYNAPGGRLLEDKT